MMPEESRSAANGKLTDTRSAALSRTATAIACTIAAAGIIAPLAVAQDDPAGGAPGDDAATAAAPPEPFDIWEYRVLGNSVLDARVIERAVYAHLGSARTIENVEAARQALETAYRDAGYSTVFVDIPEQDVDEAIVRLTVTEGRLDRVRVSGARYFSNRQILARLPALEQGVVPHFPEVQEQLATLNQQTPDRSVTPVLRAGRFPGTVDIELRVEDELPFHGSLEVNDRYTADTTQLRANLSLSYDNLWQRGHTASLQYQVAPEEPNEAAVFAATYIARLEEVKSILAFYGVDSSSDVATVGTLSVLGQGKIFGIRGIRPLEPVGAFAHNFTAGIDFKDFDEDIKLTDGDGLLTAIKYVSWSGSYGFGWNSPRAISAFSVGGAWGIRGFGNDDAEFENKRFKARANYAYLFGSAQHSRQVFGNARFMTRLNWQYSNAPLISNEQFSAGGASSVRGYLEAERLGDLGGSLTLELQSPSLLQGARVDDLRLLGFYDAAALLLEDPLPGQDPHTRLSSTGVGLRFTGLGGMQVELDWAKALRDGANVLEDEDRVHFRLSYGF